MLFSKFRLFGTSNKGLHEVAITSAGQLITAPLHYDETEFRTLGTANTAYNFYEPQTQNQFVITSMTLKADSNVHATTDTTVTIYEATDTTDTVAAKILMQFVVLKGDLVVTTPLNILVNSGVYINAKTTDDDIHMTIMGYYIPKIG